MTSDDLLQLQQPLTEGGIRSVNFFNGRLLTSKDLTREQVARREADARLGLAVGDGVAFGLEATRDTDLDKAAAPVLRVKAGLAVNRLGQTLRLVSDTSVALTRRFDAGISGGPCLFANCNSLSDGTYVAGAGVYVLTVAPAAIGEGRAPTNGLDPSNVACNTEVVVEALQFRLLGVNPQRFSDLDITSAQFRNRLAYRCFGVEALGPSLADPWRARPASYGLVDDLRAQGGALDDAEVPLAILYWTAAGLRFIDLWAVRRPLQVSGAQGDAAPLQRLRWRIENEAMCAQFQQHLGDLLATSASPASLVAREHFRHLPPFGVVPLRSLPLRGFSDDVFFSGIPRRPGGQSGQQTPFIDQRNVAALRAAALGLGPTDTTQGEFVWACRPWQGVKAARDGATVQPTLVFASGRAPDMAVARLDMARADFSNFASCGCASLS